MARISFAGAKNVKHLFSIKFCFFNPEVHYGENGAGNLEFDHSWQVHEKS
jgi:hypothetical protein